MITIGVERSTGCGECIEICPSGALYLVDGKATVDETLCRECEACLAACLNEAITLTTQEKPVAEMVHAPALRSEAEIIQIRTQSAPVPLRSRVLPMVGAALTWAGREIVPWLADLMLDALDRQATRTQTRDGARGRETQTAGAEGGGRQHRHRQRRGGGSK